MFSAIRGFMTVRGLPDCARASRIVLKDYVNGKLNYCHAPPNMRQEDFHPVHPQFSIYGGNGDQNQGNTKNGEMQELEQVLGKEKVASLA